MDQELQVPAAPNDKAVSDGIAAGGSKFKFPFGYAALGCSALALMVAVFLLGRSTSQSMDSEVARMLHASATHGGNDMAIATGDVADNNEAIYFLDFKTGDLTCFVYYPRFMRFGAKYVGNVTDQLPATKNSEYLLVTGRVDSPPTSTNTRPANSLVYVVDTKSGQFAAYSIAANPTLENSGQIQVGTFFCVGGGEVRGASAGSAKRTIPGAADPADPNAPAAPNAPEERKKRNR